LQRIIEFADPVEQEHPSCGGAEQSLALVIRTSEGSAPVTEQFTLRQPGADRRTVERDERPCAPLGIELVDGVGEEFLPCASLTGEQDRQVTERTDTQNRPKNCPNRLALPNRAQGPHDVLDARRIVLFPHLDLEMLCKVALQILTKRSPGTVEA
jgi:hypothetical protein